MFFCSFSVWQQAMTGPTALLFTTQPAKLPPRLRVPEELSKEDISNPFDAQYGQDSGFGR